MIYELRIYEATPGKLGALTRRFEDITLKFWEKHGIQPVGFWTTLIGDNANNLYYMIAWKDLAEREQKWNAFVTSPEWVKARAATETDGPLTVRITNLILSPTSFSALR